MSEPAPVRRWKLCASVALAMAIVAFLLGSGPFTPALLFAILAIPLALVCLYFGVRRLSATAIYWAIAALSAMPVSRKLGVRPDAILVLLDIAGLALSAILYYGYRRMARQHPPSSRG